MFDVSNIYHNAITSIYGPALLSAGICFLIYLFITVICLLFQYDMEEANRKYNFHHRRGIELNYFFDFGVIGFIIALLIFFYGFF